MMKRPTLQDVAAAAGVSHMTVSRVVRGLGPVRPETRERVAGAVRRLGYRPDSLLSALAAYRARVRPKVERGGLAYLDVDPSAYSRQVYEAARGEAVRWGYRLGRWGWPAEPKQQKALLRILRHRGLLGVLLGPAQRRETLSAAWLSECVVVSIGARAHAPALHSVAMDYLDGASVAAAALRRQGCRRLGLVMDAHLEARTEGRWLAGYLMEAFRQGPRLPPLLLDGAKGRRQAFREWLARARPDGILTIHAEVAAWVGETGRRLRVAFLNDVDVPRGYPCISLPAGRLGVEAVQMAHRLLHEQEVGIPRWPKTILLRGRWRDQSP